ncbi:bifunctional D-glycero-beta-D-manno-heptose-7-phosphate kinase/D-glycero-beta-D-manno-heptose 1-phosphate adenylyltransferase HldE [Thiolapillus brandeum]|uniref:Bifunctional protein HldE n=1 Tax=Thiolapillus brandeum TaxID=1076588 RepID=A0A7U6GG90_9GAMM|nr:bifunctional D-glycero-beta-D-manno-heptose-7-phosphate kinase/D-glycero-beta-D-manno-heptose 1-phosphate adenylyltransferase HldE [Thiolapillus brandeum]BAO43070.1 D-beta-D-heptose 7-phosphate kinase / D-beta-D-heptose 1-phosphate adenosyltransferase [Thiolapillus brandeum]
MSTLPDLSRARVLVAGDLMLDRYWHGATERISPEAPVPVVHVRDEEGRPGGSGNVAVNISALGGRASLLGLVGEDQAADSLESALQQAGVNTHLFREKTYPTITKLRVISRHQQLIRLDFEDGFPEHDPSGMLHCFQALLAEHDVVVLSDYGKGTLANPQAWIDLARQAGLPVLIDPKGKDFSRYRGATLITPNLSEFEAVAGSCGNTRELETAARKLLDDCALEHLLVTRGEQGMSLFNAHDEAHHLPTRAREVFDVTGAGDTVIATLATALGAGQSMESATALANLAAGIVVGKLGTASVSAVEMEHALQEQRLAEHGVVSEDVLMNLVTAARNRGERVVFTNGCFDLLHAGHVTYLEQASKLGDRLIVAVNTDETVRQLKGPERPVNPLENRMHVLAALGFVDWVVPFAEETPERLICRLQPDLLVKGGDNDPDRIPGAACVRKAGGEVKVLSYVDGVSTTSIVDSIAARSRE